MLNRNGYSQQPPVTTTTTSHLRQHHSQPHLNVRRNSDDNNSNNNKMQTTLLLEHNNNMLRPYNHSIDNNNHLQRPPAPPLSHRSMSFPCYDVTSPPTGCNGSSSAAASFFLRLVLIDLFFSLQLLLIALEIVEFIAVISRVVLAFFLNSDIFWLHALSSMTRTRLIFCVSAKTSVISHTKKPS